MKLFTIILFCLFPGFLFAQNFGEVGTKWEHCFLYIGESPPIFSLLEVESESKIFFEGLDCYVLKIGPGFTSLDSMIICNEGEKTYYVEEDILYLLYDFSLNAGDTFQIRMPNLLFSNFIEYLEAVYSDIVASAMMPKDIIIDSISTIEIDGIALKRQYVHYDIEDIEGLFFHLNIGDYITELLGYQNWIFPYPTIDNLELNPYSDIQSFDNGSIQYFETTSCFTTATVEVLPSTNFTIIPNPTRGFISIEGDLNSIFRIDIFDGAGLLAQQITKPLNTTYDTSHLNNDLYFLVFYMKDGSFQIEKMLKI